jgi:glycosyltransferase involved in cell wall biosynthesis
MKTSIIIPAHNEEKRIPNTLNNYYKFFKSKSEPFEFIIVLNACKDNTKQVVEKIAKGKKEIIVLDFKEPGKGLAIKRGFLNALKRKNDLIGFVDADSSTSPEAFYDLIKNVGDNDGIIASRYSNGAKVYPKQTLKRRIVSRIGNMLIRVLFLLNYKDTQCGAKLFKRKFITKIVNELNITGWAFDVHLLYLAKIEKAKIVELPTIWEDKEGSTLDIKKASIKFFLSLIKLRLTYSPFKFLLKTFNKFEVTLWKILEEK